MITSFFEKISAKKYFGYPAVYALVVCLSVGVAIFSISTHVGWNDYSGYFLQANGVIAGDLEAPVQAVTWANEHSSIPESPNSYPWGYPLVIAPIIAALGYNIVWIKSINVLFFLFFEYFFIRFIFERNDEKNGWIPLALVGFSPAYLARIDTIDSEIVFIGLLFYSIFLFERYRKETNLKNALILSFSIFLLMIVRTVGFVFLILLLAPVTKVKSIGPKKVIGYLAYSFLFFVGCLFVNSLIFPTGETAYLGFLDLTTFTRIFRNISKYALSLSTFLEIFSNAKLLSIGFAILTLASFVIYFKKNPILNFTMAAYLLVIFIYPYYGAFRFLLPIFPYFLYVLVLGSAEVFRKNNVIRSLALLGVVFLISISTFRSVEIAVNNMKLGRISTNPSGPMDSSMLEVYRYINMNTPTDAVIAFYKPRSIILFTGRKAFRSDECAMLQTADYLIYPTISEHASMLTYEQASNCEGMRFVEVDANEHFLILRSYKP